MSERSFEIQLPTDVGVEEGFRRARVQAKQVGISIEGDPSGGTFSGTAGGTYRVADGVLHLTVAKKPAFVPWSMVERGIRRIEEGLPPDGDS